MYRSIKNQIKDFLQNNITAEEIQVGDLGDFNMIDLRKSAILLEPRSDRKAAKSIRWKQSDYEVRLWVMVSISQQYDQAMQEMERIIGAEDDDAGEIVGLFSALDRLKQDPTFSQLAGSFGGKKWRIKGGDPLSYNEVDFGMSTGQNSQKICTGMVSLIIHFDQEG